MNYEKMKKADLIEHIKTLKEEKASLAYDMKRFKESAQYLSAEVYRNEKEIASLANQFETLEEETKTLKIENGSLANKIETLNTDANAQRRSLKRRRLKLADMNDKKEEAIQSLFDLYSTVLLEHKWNDRIDWKNDVLNEIQQLIRQLS